MAGKKKHTIAEKVSARIKQLRMQRKITQEQFLFDTKLHVGRMETQPMNFQVDTIETVCKYFGISLKEFFEDGFD
ncbi:MAG TPA: helix-turn-helix transcriptional regulator [Bacteroidia bacterium]|nr:helix-turn-helix transcriptional regulator [Bacteroidia bacterium]HNU34805.1 helix-turn-helix transcriptional regulator [Bacteroidia bacterium]